MTRFDGVCPTCKGRNGVHGGHCPNHGKLESEWTTHEDRVAARMPYDLARALADCEALLPDGAHFWMGHAAEKPGFYFVTVVWGGWLDARERQFSIREVAPSMLQALIQLTDQLRDRR